MLEVGLITALLKRALRDKAERVMDYATEDFDRRQFEVRDGDDKFVVTIERKN